MKVHSLERISCIAVHPEHTVACVIPWDFIAGGINGTYILYESIQGKGNPAKGNSKAPKTCVGRKCQEIARVLRENIVMKFGGACNRI